MKKILISFKKLLCVASLLFSAENIFAGDISFYAVIKQQDWIQTNSGASVLDSGTPYRFECVVDSSQSNVLNSASVQLPSGGSRTLQPDGPDSFHFKESFASTSALNSTYGTGTYSLTVDSVNDFASFAQLTMPSDDYPNAPEILNFTAAQSIDPTNSFTLTWNAFSGGTTNDFIQVAISPANGYDVFNTEGPGQPGSLNGTNTSVVIPANTLMAGQSYHVELFFGKITTINSTSIPGANGVVGFAKRTKLIIQTTAAAGAISFYGVIKQQNFLQTNNDAPVFPAVDSPFAFQTFIDATVTNFVTSASVRSPDTVLHTLAPEGNGQFWAFQQYFNTQPELNNAYGSGNYALTVQVQTATNTNTYNVTLPLTGDSYPNAPQLTNFTAAQSINPSNNFTLYWNAFNGGTTNDFVQVQINTLQDSTIWQSGQPGMPDALNGTSPSFFQIPANTLSPGTSYTVQILFARAVTLDRTSIPESFGFSSYVKKTAANIRTTGTPFEIQLQVIGFVGGQFQFKFNSRPGRGYQIEWTDNLPGGWGPLMYINATSSETVFTDTFSVVPKRFYRVQEQ